MGKQPRRNRPGHGEDDRSGWNGPGRVGVRTCVACRQEAGKAALVRFVRSPAGAVSVDRTGRAAGRGAYVHASADCIAIARKRRSLDRALGTGVPPEIWGEFA